jgi:hypothetical protein
MAAIEIFIGAPIQHASERATLQRAVDYLSAQGLSAVILANLLLEGRQIDLVVALDPGGLVVESKGITSPVRGGRNGDWEIRLSSGSWKRVPNAYAQANDQALALRDAMSKFAGAEAAYPDAAVVFVPALPAGSSIPNSDFRVSFGSLADLPQIITAIRRRRWSLDQWRRFAAHHRLIRVQSVEAALSDSMLGSELLLRSYEKAFEQTYGPAASEFVAVRCINDGQELSSDVVLDQSASNENSVLTGPSGCGKSLLTYKIAVAALARGEVPIVVPTKDFDGSLRDVVNREAALLDARSATELIVASRKLGRRLLLVVDGYNECTPSERQRLTRSIAAAVRRATMQGL